MNLKALKKINKQETKQVEKAATKAIEVLEITHSDGRSVEITKAEQDRDAMLGLMIQELIDATEAGNNDTDLDKFRDGIINRYQSLTQNNTVTVGDLLKDAKKENVEKKVAAKQKEEEVENDLPIDLATIAPHIGKFVVCHIANPNMRSTKVGKKTVASFGYVVTSGETAEEETISDIMIHGSNMDAGMSLATKHGCVVKGVLDWDFSKERYQLRDIKMVQGAEVTNSPVAILTEWLDKNVAYNANNDNVGETTWVTLNKEVGKLHPTKIEDFLNEKFPTGIILVNGKGSSQSFFYEKK